MKTLVTTLTERGRTSIPADIRKRLQLKPGTRLAWEAVSGQECRIVAQQSRKREGAHAMRGYAKTFRTPRTSDKWMAELRAGEQK